MTILEEIRSTAGGLALLKDWLGDGEPVQRRYAQARAFICEYCPLNVQPGWWDRVKDAVAGVIRRQLALKAKMDMELVNEPRLGVCSACGCCVRLKVWVPLPHVINHTNNATMNALDKNCWIKKELSP